MACPSSGADPKWYGSPLLGTMGLMSHDSQQSAISGRPAEYPKGWVGFVVTGTWLGLAPVASGTFGALWGLPLTWAIQQLHNPWIQGCVIALVCAIGVPLCTAAVRAMGGIEDPGCVVLDEIVSLPITFFLVPVTGAAVVIVGFLLNRAFDIVKPPPARQLEQLPEGLGIMADDWMAGVYSNLALHAMIWLDGWNFLGG